MFTGLIEAIGRVVDMERAASGHRLRLQTAIAGELKAGDSLAVNGVCLTVVSARGDHVEVDVGPETVRVTTLAAMERGQAVNLERSMRADGRFGGHFVLGHVDGTGRITQIRDEGGAHWVTVSFGDALVPYLIPKGSIAVDGISLTVAALGASTFDVMIVPHTWQHTTVSGLGVGDRVNLECDVVGKYVVRAADVATRRVTI